MATNKGFSAFDDLEDKPVKEIMKGADLRNKNNKGGRKPKDVKADKTIRVYVTTEQKDAIEEYCLRTGSSESTLVKQLLIKEGVF